jgi:hypothetical protein
MKRPLIYRSTVRGHHDDDLDAEPQYPYYGFVQRVPKGTDLTTEMFVDLERLAQPRWVHGFLAEPVPGEPFERYEVFDADSDDILVMYRAPFRPVEEGLAVFDPVEVPPLPVRGFDLNPTELGR